MNRESDESTAGRRSFLSFSHRGATYRIHSKYQSAVTQAIVTLRKQLEVYIDGFPAFRDSLVPVPPAASAPPIALDMHRAALTAGVGPLAAVAGAMAEHAASAATDAGDDDVVVENGGDIFLCSARGVCVSLFAGASPLSHRLAFEVTPDSMPISICSSSGVMGHSWSFGSADLVTVIAKNGALADAAATALCNLVKSEADIEEVLKRGESMEGIDGVLVIVGERLGVVGDLPELVAQEDSKANLKISQNRA